MTNRDTIFTKTAKISVESIEIQTPVTRKGIDASALEMVINHFFTFKSKWSGLGLTISKRLFDKHSYSIMIVNNSKGWDAKYYNPTSETEK